jgi:hypothetical protein
MHNVRLGMMTGLGWFKAAQAYRATFPGRLADAVLVLPLLA